MYDNVSEIEWDLGKIASGHADADPYYVHTLSENSIGGSTGPFFRIANVMVAPDAGRDVLYANVRDNGYMIFDRPDGQQQIVADVRYYTIDDAWNLLTGAADGHWAVRDESPAETKRQMQAPDEQGDGSLLCHLRPFSPGDRVRFADGAGMGTLMWMQPQRGWFVQDDSGRNHANVHEDGMTLVEHAKTGDERVHQGRHRQDFQVRRMGQLWRDAAIIHADTIVRKDGILHFAHNAKVVSSWVEADVEVRQLCDAGA